MSDYRKHLNGRGGYNSYPLVPDYGITVPEGFQFVLQRNKNGGYKKPVYEQNSIPGERIRQ
jgi:hypothetical protein